MALCLQFSEVYLKWIFLFLIFFLALTQARSKSLNSTPYRFLPWEMKPMSKEKVVTPAEK